MGYYNPAIDLHGGIILEAYVGNDLVNSVDPW
jgi:hypothetical protein